MRDIKFRAWDKDQNIMLFDFDQNTPGVKLGQSIHLKVYETGLMHGTLMQYTGLKDKNGVEIYEGDIVTANCSKSGQSNKKIRNHVCTLYWQGNGYHLSIHHKGEKWATCHSNWTTEREWEVIGNEYQTPELLNP